MSVTLSGTQVPRNAVGAALTRVVPDKAAMLPLVETVLSWDLNRGSLPEVDVSLNLVKAFTAYGRVLEGELAAVCCRLPADSDLRCGPQATLSEAGRRLYMPPPGCSERGAAHRAQNLARLIQALLRGTGSAAPAPADEGTV
ncbi:DUF6415 family natural product biosynthesis protein [Streptomyces sp. MCA2]|uniref:DUF6415 family natural product biosynthesis protein n=1 Tax=Streptomyces sp. MCA2 TaxID=2944805 RepID=UPI0020204A16|nr:DUF6415 family natural product biosynthesis protein [Streptomyces sp. MCA2]MCL7493074.1 DUF6415 family natural product biosynthesis protein [Streptomyces sp. MCA2]